MKINLLFFCLIIVIHVPGSAQELLALQNADRSNTFELGGEIRNTTISGADEALWKRGYTALRDSSENRETPNKAYPRFRLALGGGYSYRIAAISDDASPEMAEYLRGLKSGFHFQGEIAHYVSSKIGVGAYYSIMHAKTSGDLLVTNEPFTNTREVNSTVNIHFVGPHFSLRLFNASGQNASLINLSLCYMIYDEETRVALSPYRISGNTFGMVISYAYEMGVSDNVAIGAKLSAILASGNHYEQEIHFPTQPAYLESGELEDFNRVDLSLYLRFGKM